MRPRLTIRGIFAQRARGDISPTLFAWESLEPVHQQGYRTCGDEARITIMLRDSRQSRVARALWVRAVVRAWRAGRLNLVEDHSRERRRMMIGSVCVTALITALCALAASSMTANVWWWLVGGVVGFAVSVAGMNGPLRIVLDRRCATRVSYGPEGFHATLEHAATDLTRWEELEEVRTMLTRAEVRLRDGTRIRMLISPRAKLVLREQLRVVHGWSAEGASTRVRAAVIRGVWYCIAGGVIAGVMGFWLTRAGLAPRGYAWTAAALVGLGPVGALLYSLLVVSVNGYGFRFWRSRSWRRLVVRAIRPEAARRE